MVVHESLSFAKPLAIEKSGALANSLANLVVAAPGADKVIRMRTLRIIYNNATAALFKVKFGPGTLVEDEDCDITLDDVAHTIANLPIRPSTLVVTVTHAGGVAVLSDDGAGALTHTSGVAMTGLTATINYTTGALVIGAVENISEALATYRYDVERFLGYASAGNDFVVGIPAEGFDVTPDATANHALYIASTVVATYSLVYQTAPYV